MNVIVCTNAGKAEYEDGIMVAGYKKTARKGCFGRDGLYCKSAVDGAQGPEHSFGKAMLCTAHKIRRADFA